MHPVTENAFVTCAHRLGVVGLAASQRVVSIQGHAVLVEPDPVGKPIVGCPNAGPAIKPCTATLPLKTGYSRLLRIGGRPVCLETLEGFTDGTPPGNVTYSVRRAGQTLVEASA